MTYSTTQDVVRYLGKDAYTRVRGELLGTGNGVQSSWTSSQLNFISGSTSLYTGTALTSSIALTSSAYSTNLDEGKFIYTASSNAIVSADYDYCDIQDSQISSMISTSDAIIKTWAGRTFDSASTTEYFDTDGRDTYFTENYPIITISSLEINIAGQTDTPTWSTSTEGYGYDFINNAIDKRTGRIRFIDNIPETGKDRVKVSYQYGYATIPAYVKELSILLTLKSLSQSSLYRSLFKGYDGFTPSKVTEIDNQIEELRRIISKQDISSI